MRQKNPRWQRQQKPKTGRVNEGAMETSENAKKLRIEDRKWELLDDDVCMILHYIRALMNLQRNHSFVQPGMTKRELRLATNSAPLVLAVSSGYDA